MHDPFFFLCRGKRKAANKIPLREKFFKGCKIFDENIVHNIPAFLFTWLTKYKFGE